MKVQEALGGRVGREVFLYSITLDPEHDTPEVLKKYAEAHGVKPGWSFLTGRKEDIEPLRRKLGFYHPDPVKDADKKEHSGMVVFGNEALGRWGSTPALQRPETIVRAIERLR